jgi:uncharacterized repeat protein (TIGR03803 family)
MHEFNCLTDQEGQYPWTELVFTTNLRDSGLDSGGALYGTTLWGGQIGTGSFFRIDLSGNFWDMHKTPGSVTYSDDMDNSLWGLIQGSIPYGTSTKQVLFGGAQYGGLNNTGWIWHFWWYV